MNIRVLQGLNLKYPVTTVVAELRNVKPELLDFFKQLHPVFMIDYTIVDATTVEIQTHLPNIWKNTRVQKAIEDYSTGTTSFEDAKKQLLEITRLMIFSMSTIPTLHAAHTLGYETFQFFINKDILSKKLLNRYYNIGIGKETTVTVSAGSVGDSVLGYKTQRDKWFTNQFLDTMGLPIAAWSHVEDRKDLPDIAKRIGLPLVIKPVGLTGGHAVFVGIKTVNELEQAYDKIKAILAEKPQLAAWQGEIIVQKMVTGDDYRILVIGGTVEIATHRIPARITGDGIHTIQQLVEQENENPQRDISLPTHTLKYIVIDEELEHVVRENGYSLNDIPPKDEVVYVRKVASMSQGGITKDVTDLLHPQTRAICESISTSVHTNVLGVDILCKDISKPLTPENGTIIEMNTMPEIYLNAFPVIGNQHPDIGEKIVRSLIDPNIHTNTVVAMGSITPESITKIVAKEIENTSNIGVYSQHRFYINGNLINDNIDTESAVLALKRNKSLDTIVLHYDSIEEIEENGMGFNTIDLLITTPQAVSSVEAVVSDYQQKGLIHNIITV